MIFEIKIPSPGESITEVEIGKWLVENGSIVKKDQEIAEIESDKATLSLTASETGKLTTLFKEGERVAVGTVICTVDDAGQSQPAESDLLLLNKKQKLRLRLQTIKTLLKAYASNEAGSAYIEGQMGRGCIFCAASGNFTFRFLIWYRTNLK